MEYCSIWHGVMVPNQDERRVWPGTDRYIHLSDLKLITFAEIRLPDFGLRFELAQWLSGKSFEIQVARAISGWHHHLKTYNIVPESTEIIQYTLQGDLDKVKSLFNTKMASVYDRDIYGRSLLWVIALFKTYH